MGKENKLRLNGCSLVAEGLIGFALLGAPSDILKFIGTAMLIDAFLGGIAASAAINFLVEPRQ